MADITVWPSAGANSYISQANATKYFAGAIHNSAWVEADDDPKSRALITAARMLDRLNWGGARTSASQDLAFPRTGLLDRDGAALASDAIPQDIIDAQCEIALALLENVSAQTGSGGGNVKSLQTSHTTVEFFESRGSAGPLPDIAQRLVGHLLSSSNVNAAGASYGTDSDETPSRFEDRDQWDRTEPFG